VVVGEYYPGCKSGDRGSGLQIPNSAVGIFRTAWNSAVETSRTARGRVSFVVHSLTAAENQDSTHHRQRTLRIA
jgi:hypothetical protein